MHLFGTKITLKEDKQETVYIKTRKEEACSINSNFWINLSDEKINTKDIIKIEEPIYETVYEYKKILDDKEKEYLSNVIKPFRDSVIYIEKRICYDDKYQFLLIKYRENDGIDKLTFPKFKVNTMYKEMKINKEYSLEELEL